MSSYFAMTDFRATLCAPTGDNNTTVPIPQGAKKEDTKEDSIL